MAAPRPSSPWRLLLLLLLLLLLPAGGKCLGSAVDSQVVLVVAEAELEASHRQWEAQLRAGKKRPPAAARLLPRPAM